MALIFDTVRTENFHAKGSTNNARFMANDWGLKLQSDHGYIHFGPANTGHAHIYTDRSNFYFNKQIQLLGGTLINDSNIQSNLFYDKDNTTYFLNPASTADSFYTQGRIRQTNQNNSTWPYLFTTTSVGNDNHSGFWVASNGYPDMRLRREDGTVRAKISSWERSITSFGFTDSTDMRAPIFYDNNNTTYYLNAASGNTSHALKVNGQIYRDGFDTTSNGDNNKIIVGQDYSSWIWNTSTNWGIFWAGNDNAAYKYFSTSNPNELAFVGSGTLRASIDLDNGQSYFGTSVRSPQFYDSNNTGYYIHGDGTSRLNIVNANAVGTSVAGIGKVMFPYGAEYNSGSTTGAIKITLPQSWTNTMMTMKITIYDYSINESFEVHCGGYNHTGGNGYWVNTHAKIIANGDVDRNFNVRFGHDGSKCCITIGETTSHWAYPKVVVTEWVGGHSSETFSNWDNGWDISIVTTLPSQIDQVRSNNQVGRYQSIVYDANNTNYYTDPDSTSNLNAVNANTISISGNSNLGNGNGDVTRVNDILHVGASDSGNASIIFGEDSSNWYGAHLYWDSGYRFYWKTRNAGTDTDLFYYDTNSTSYIHWNRNHDLNNKALHYVSELHFQDNVRFQDMGNDQYLKFKWGDSGAGGIRFYDGDDIHHGYIYGDGGGRFGLLDNDGQWAVKIGVGTEPMQLHCDNNAEFYVYNSYTYSPGSSRAPIFYDSDNTAYYVDAVGNSQLGSLVLNGSTTRGTYTAASQYHSGADNLVLKGNSSGISGIFFESEKDGTNINHATDFGFIQFHPYGTGTSGESNELIIGVSNDTDDHVVFNAPTANGLKFRVGSSATDYNVWHSGNDGSGSGLDADTVDGIDSSRIIYGNNSSGTNEGNYSNWDTLDKTGFYSHSGASGRWSSAANWSSVLHFRLYDDNNNYASQLGFNTYDNRIYARTRNAGTWTSWDEIITSGNIGSQSVSNADKVDNLHAASLLRSDDNDTYNPNNAAIALRYQVDDGAQIASSGSSQRFPLEVYANNGTDAAIIFHIGGDYAGYFGLDAANNDLYWGGWSVGSSTKHRIWHAGNDGSLMKIGQEIFSSSVSDDTSGPLEFIRGSNNWDDYIIKHGSSKGLFGKQGIGWHNHTNSSFHVFSSGWTANFGVNSDGTSVSRSSSRAPVFYDSNNTSYYVDAASTSTLNNLRVNTVNGQDTWEGTITINGDANTYYPVGWYGGEQAQVCEIEIFRNYSEAAPSTWNTSTHKGGLVCKIRANWGGWGGVHYDWVLDDFRETYSTMVAWAGQFANSRAFGLKLRGGGAIYHVRIKGRSVGPTITYGTWDPGNNSTGIGSTTSVDSTLLNKRNYIRSGNLYSNDNLVLDHGGSHQTKSGTLQSDASLRAPIFYDSNNTTYYVDPSSTGASIKVRGTIENPSIWINDGDNYNNYNENIRLFNPANGVSVIGFACTGTGGVPASSILGYSDRHEVRRGSNWETRTYDGYQVARGSYRAPIFYDSDDTNSYFDRSRLILRSGDPTIIFRDTDHTSAMWHVNSHRMYLLRGNGDTTSWSQVNGQWPVYWDLGNNNAYFGGTVVATNAVTAPIFYDSNNTGYYLNPASTSNLNVVQAKSIRNDGSVSSDDGFGIYWENTASTSYAIYREAGSWSNPYPDLRIAFHTGIKLGGHKNYDGIRFYNNSDMATITASIGDGDDNMRSYYDIIAYASDRRLKTNVEPITNAIDKVKSLQGMTYNWNEVGKEYGWEPSEEREVGVFAQDVQEVLPEAVKLAPFDQDHDTEGNMYSKSGENFLTVKYEKIVPLLIEAIKEQQAQIDELKKLVSLHK